VFGLALEGVILEGVVLEGVPFLGVPILAWFFFFFGVPSNNIVSSNPLQRQ